KKRRAYGNCHRRHALKCRLAIRTLPEALLRNEQVPEAWKSARTYLCCKNAFLFDACMHTPFRGGLSIFHFYLSCLRQRPNCCIPYPSSIPLPALLVLQSLILRRQIQKTSNVRSGKRN